MGDCLSGTDLEMVPWYGMAYAEADWQSGLMLVQNEGEVIPKGWRCPHQLIDLLSQALGPLHLLVVTGEATLNM